MTGPSSLVVVGASLAGLRAVEAARKDGYDGAITLVGAEPHLPYDRPPLSNRVALCSSLFMPNLDVLGMLAGMGSGAGQLVTKLLTQPMATSEPELPEYAKTDVG